MAAGEEHYRVLGVPRQASADEVKKAYRALSRQYHPDKAAHLDEPDRRDRERQMVALNVAYQVIMSPRQRRAYDLTRPSTPRRAQSCAPPTTPGYAASEPAAADIGFRRPPVPGAAGSRPPKPRYQNGGKYTQRSRQARRMDPAQYTTHIDGRAAEFSDVDPPHDAGPSPSPPAPPFGGAPGSGAGATPAAAMPPPGVKNPMWLQRQLDIAHEWERLYCPEPNEEAYQWKRACSDCLAGVRERRQNREQLGADPPSFSPTAAAA